MAGALLLGASVAACAPSPQAARYTVEEYRADDRLRREQVARCKDDPGTLRDTPDCVNAMQAEQLEGIGSFKDLPPVNLPET